MSRGAEGHAGTEGVGETREQQKSRLWAQYAGGSDEYKQGFDDGYEVADVLTADQRADIAFVVRCLKEVCCDIETPYALTPEGADIARRVESLATGGTDGQ